MRVLGTADGKDMERYKTKLPMKICHWNLPPKSPRSNWARSEDWGLSRSRRKLPLLLLQLLLEFSVRHQCLMLICLGPELAQMYPTLSVYHCLPTSTCLCCAWNVLAKEPATSSQAQPRSAEKKIRDKGRLLVDSNILLWADLTIFLDCWNGLRKH